MLIVKASCYCHTFSRPICMLTKCLMLLFIYHLSMQLVETETVTENCRSRCAEQGIIFFRLNPRLEEVIEASETNNEKLFDMILQTRMEMIEHNDLGNLVLNFHMLSDVCRKVYAQIQSQTMQCTPL